MPIYECRILGDETPRLVKADTDAGARRQLVTAKAISAERMAELLDKGVTLSVAPPANNDESETRES